MCVCVLVCSFVMYVLLCFVFVTVCVSLLLHPSVECGSVRALVIVSDMGCCLGGRGGGGAGIWHILGSMPMRAAWSSKQIRVEPLNQSLSLILSRDSISESY